MTLTRTFGVQVLACAVWLSAGCGGAAPPVRTQTDAVAAVGAARALGAENTPEAAYHLALAEDQIRQAQALIQQGRMEPAERVLERAKVDAELALALQREADVRMHQASRLSPLEGTEQRQPMDGR